MCMSQWTFLLFGGANKTRKGSTSGLQGTPWDTCPVSNAEPGRCTPTERTHSNICPSSSNFRDCPMISSLPMAETSPLSNWAPPLSLTSPKWKSNALAYGMTTRYDAYDMTCCVVFVGLVETNQPNAQPRLVAVGHSEIHGS